MLMPRLAGAASAAVLHNKAVTCPAGGLGAGAAVSLGDGQPEDAKLLHRVDELARVGVAVLEIARDRTDAGLDPVVDDRDDVALVGVEICDLRCCHGGLASRQEPAPGRCGGPGALARGVPPVTLA